MDTPTRNPALEMRPVAPGGLAQRPSTRTLTGSVDPQVGECLPAFKRALNLSNYG